jgi:hypothetical protein
MNEVLTPTVEFDPLTVAHLGQIAVMDQSTGSMPDFGPLTPEAIDAWVNQFNQGTLESEFDQDFFAKEGLTAEHSDEAAKAEELSILHARQVLGAVAKDQHNQISSLLSEQTDEDEEDTDVLPFARKAQTKATKKPSK